VTYFTFPETRGYSLEEIAEVFDGPKAALAEEGCGKEKEKQAEFGEHIEGRDGST
jgi:hypothetical protein